MFKVQSFWAPALAVTVVACGARFSAHENEGTATGNAGEGSAGFTSSGGSSSVADAGEPGVGGHRAAGGNSSVTGGTGSAAGGAGTAGRNWGNGGWGSWGVGGWGSGGGGATAADCATLRQKYQAAVEEARACDKGSTDQCSPSSVAEQVGGCGCPILINTKSDAADAAKKAYQGYQDAKCEHGAICDAFCAPFASASCEESASGGYVCTAGGLLK